MLKIKGIILKIALKKANITQEKAGEMLGVARQTVGIWMKSDELSDEVILNVKEKLGIDLADMVVLGDGNTEELPPIIQALIQSKDEMIQELKADKEKLFKLLEGR